MTPPAPHCPPFSSRSPRGACRTAGSNPWQALAFVVGLALPGLAPADTLGDARQLSHVGEPLRVSIPVLSDGTGPLVERCLAPFGPRAGDGLPHIVTAHVGVERQGASANVIVTTAAPVRDSMVRLLLRVGCDGTSRSYTLFLEPVGSTRMLRAVAQPGPRLPAASASEATPETSAAIPSANVTVIPVAPSNRAEATAPATPATPGALAPSALGKGAAAGTTSTARPEPTAKASAKPVGPTGAALMTDPALALNAAADASAAGMPAAVLAGESGANAGAGADPKAAALEAENETLKQQVARMSGEIQRLQVEKPGAADSRRETAPLPGAPRWDVALPMLIALAGLLAVIVGGLLWHRRHAAPAGQWPVGGPPSHRMASRTSLGDHPVSFRPSGVHGAPQTNVDLQGLTDTPAGARPEGTPPTEAAPPLAPAPLRLQPSPEDLARELEQELKVAERSHSALERSHPDLVETLTRAWGTAAARNHLSTLLTPGSPDLGRMSGEVVSELRMLLRVAEDLPHRTGFDAANVGFTPPAPAW